MGVTDRAPTDAGAAQGGRGTSPGGRSDALVERCLSELAGGEGRIDCSTTLARTVLTEAFAEHARALAGQPDAGGLGAIRYTFREGKALPALQIFLRSLGGVWVSHAVALRGLYAAERAHVLDHGRPIFGDAYRAMPTGPVGMTADRVLRGDLSALSDPRPYRIGLAWAGDELPEVVGEPDLDALSRTDVETLEAAARACLAGRPADTWLRQVDRGWRLTRIGDCIDWSVIPDPAEPDHAPRLERMREWAVYGA